MLPRGCAFLRKTFLAARLEALSLDFLFCFVGSVLLYVGFIFMMTEDFFAFPTAGGTDLMPYLEHFILILQSCMWNQSVYTKELIPPCPFEKSVSSEGHTSIRTTWFP